MQLLKSEIAGWIAINIFGYSFWFITQNSLHIGSQINGSPGPVVTALSLVAGFLINQGLILLIWWGLSTVARSKDK
jgi:hypothetical protein